MRPLLDRSITVVPEQQPVQVIGTARVSQHDAAVLHGGGVDAGDDDGGGLLAAALAVSDAVGASDGEDVADMILPVTLVHIARTRLLPESAT